MWTLLGLVFVTIVLFIAARIIAEPTWKRIVDVAAVMATILAVIAIFRTVTPSSPAESSNREVVLTTDQPISSIPLSHTAETSSINPTNTISPTETKEPPQPTSTATVTPTVTPAPKPGDILYQADWSNGTDSWTVNKSWNSVNNMLVNDGTEEALAFAPFKPGMSIRDYAVEVEIQAVREDFCGMFGVVARSSYYGGIKHRACYGPNHQAIISGEYPYGLSLELQSIGYNPGGDWHTYRLEVKGNEIRLYIDGALYLEVIDNKYLEGGQVGLFSNGVQVSFRNFKVIAL